MLDEYVHINVLFRQMTPEILLPNIFVSNERAFLSVNSREISEEAYRHCARSLPENLHRTEDEIIQRFRNLCDFLRHTSSGGIFSLLAGYAQQVLFFQNAEPLCRQEYILEWRERSLLLGQDLFTCAGLAYVDVLRHRVSRNFSWPSAIHTDHMILRRMLAQGISENHFHLNGSTQIFSLTWSFLMNHPNKVENYFKSPYLRENLKATTSYGTSDNKITWQEWLYIAVWIRMYLFKGIHGSWDEYDFPRFMASCDKGAYLKDSISILQYSAAKLKQTSHEVCLDYTILESIAEDNSGANRLLAGERSFLYDCFFRCFTQQFDYSQMDLFYLYLLIKMRFREELIQSNDRYGFRNFSDYQDRKALVWGDDSAYWEESYWLSSASVLTDQEEEKYYVQSLEMRIMPQKSKKKLLKQIKDIDIYTENALEKCKSIYLRNEAQAISVQEELEVYKNRKQCYLEHAQNEAQYFYVLHFAKTPLKPITEEEYTQKSLSPRNAIVRANVEKQAKATMEALKHSSYLSSRIRAIDACSHEIGCRPETFATAFRYLRNFCYTSSTNSNTGFKKSVRYWPQIRATYHSGEDFLDLADGLRAIDEAICFLNLTRGDRLGHALALGTVPEQYYRIKGNCIYLPKQDLLDNIVWLLFRSIEWNVFIPSELRNSMELQAKQMLHDIYGEGCQEGTYFQHRWLEYDLIDYYKSWKLRGDDPSVYSEILNRSDNERVRNFLSGLQSTNSEYERAKLDEQLWDYARNVSRIDMRQPYDVFLASNAQLDRLSRKMEAVSYDMRSSRKVQTLLYYYHYGLHERVIGQEIVRFQISPMYIQLIHDIQECMMLNIMTMGIAIECNPSSNKLIGTFDKYERHPIFRFNHSGLALPEYPNQRVQLQVSVNTDDQGVFDTSLENEYAILYGCLQERTGEDLMRLFSDDSILGYLNHIRIMGNQMAFPKAQQGVQQMD